MALLRNADLRIEFRGGGGLSQGKLGSLGAKPLGKLNIWEMFSCKVNISFKIIFA